MFNFEFPNRIQKHIPKLRFINSIYIQHLKKSRDYFFAIKTKNNCLQDEKNSWCKFHADWKHSIRPIPKSVPPPMIDKKILEWYFVTSDLYKFCFSKLKKHWCQSSDKRTDCLIFQNSKFQTQRNGLCKL